MSQQDGICLEGYIYVNDKISKSRGYVKMSAKGALIIGYFANARNKSASNRFIIFISR